MGTVAGSSSTARARILARAFFCAAQVEGANSGRGMAAAPRIRYKELTNFNRFLQARSAIMKVKGKAPDFSIPDETGKTGRLKEFRGKEVGLACSPKATTPAQTRERSGCVDA